jgi:hypothetical protein
MYTIDWETELLAQRRNVQTYTFATADASLQEANERALNRAALETGRPLHACRALGTTLARFHGAWCWHVTVLVE